MRLLSVTSLLLAMVLVAGCNRDPETVAGRWGCSTRHPGGYVSNDIFEFGADGKLLLDSNEMPMHGSYTQNEMTLTMQLVDVPVPQGMGPNSTQQQTLTATIKKLTNEELQMDISTGSDSHMSQCRRG